MKILENYSKYFILNFFHLEKKLIAFVVRGGKNWKLHF